MAHASDATRSFRSSAARISFRIWIGFFQTMLTVARPIVDLATRLYLAQALVMASVMMAALAGASAEPGLMMSPMAVAASGGLGGLFLSLGLFTRLSAASLLLSVVARHHGLTGAGDEPSLIILLVWYILRGPEALSFDRALALGMRASALPFTRPVMRILDWPRALVAPSYLTLVRLWVAAALVRSSIMLHAAPAFSMAVVSRPVAIGLAGFLAIGLALPVVLPILILLVAGTLMMGSQAGANLYTLLVLGLLVFQHGGRLTADSLIGERLHAHFLFDRPHDPVPPEWPHVVIVGAGFGGLACATRMRSLPVRVTLIDRHNYHLFQPLLYQVATAGLSPADVATPIRGLFLHARNVNVRLGSVTGVDAHRNCVMIGSKTVPYDYLVLATGSAHSYFGRDDWAPFAPGLKRIEDGVAARSKVLSAFEHAEAISDAEEVRRLLTFVVIGGGPTGVELAGALAELACTGLSDHYRAIDPASARIILVQAGERVLPSFAASLSVHASASLADLGVEIRTNARVTEIDGDGVLIGTERIRAATVLWAAGVAASPAADWMKAERDRAGRIVVSPDLRVGNHSNVFAIGDTAASSGWNGQAVPGLAPAAKQGGIYVASFIRTLLQQSVPPPPFRYRHMGSLATIGRKSAVADFGFARFRGTLAWWLWGAIHVAFLVASATVWR